ncbi:polysaccharide deacetylase [Peptacetobacter hominis]|uniref:Polysaccharide deacetylase n=1 Tax=Peptacetobacter hominis TaxID=2743610 RepID=A0A544QXX1_9FIRM|nr:polysaccharide deacetylase family protein [Peptacetobacter hominis]TQQ85511.1 polysaccharide deacetylase [Peptacetobacter hominis]
MKNKKLIILILALIVLIGGTGKTISYMQEQKRIKIEQEKQAKIEAEKRKYMIGCSNDAKQFSYDAKEIGKRLDSYKYSNDGKKMVFLTFDDGTSTTVTPQVLKTLKENDVHATFFVTGSNIEKGGEKAKDLLKQELAEGHAIANHSYSHDYKTLYPNRTLDFNAFKADFDKNDKLLKDILGKYFSTRVIRCPGGHMSWKGMDTLDTYLEKNNMVSIDWNSLNQDAEGPKKVASQLSDIAIKESKDKDIVVLLMHDTYGKEETAKALPQIIKYFKDNGYEFKTLR